jgi:pSer/pThr/pTyr-binding forkhead associated (FHA) protein
LASACWLSGSFFWRGQNGSHTIRPVIYRLIMLTGPLQGRRVTVERAPMTLGRAPDCTLVIPDDEVAQKHAVLEHRLDGLTVRDLGAMGKILVNGREVREAKLRHGDEVELGNTRFLVQALVQAEVTNRGRTKGLSRVVALLAALVAISAVGFYAYRTYRQVNDSLGPEPSAGSESPLPPAATSAPPAQATSDWSVVEHSLMATSAPVQTVMVVTQADPRVAEEVRTLREDITTLRTRMQELTVIQNTATSTPPPPTVVTMAPPAVAVSPVDAVQEKVAGMMASAAEKEAAGDLAAADRVLDAVQILAPDCLASYERRARLYEKRGMIERAMEQWLELVERGKTTALHGKAMKEFQRLDGQVPVAKPAQVGRLKILSLDHRKFQASAEFSEMRVLEALLSNTASNAAVDPASVRLDVNFFDEDLATGKIVPTHAIVTVSPSKTDRQWAAGEQRALTATYVKPRTSGAASRKEQFYGYLVRVYAGKILQDEDARPKSLLKVGAP